MSEPDALLEMTDHATRESRIGAMKLQEAVETDLRGRTEPMLSRKHYIM